MVFQGKPEGGLPGGESIPLNAHEERLKEITEVLARLEVRVQALESARSSEMHSESSAPTPSQPPHAAPVQHIGEGDSTLLLGLVGKTFLVLGGAFLIRALTDSDKLPHLVGVMVGLAYAATWAILGDRAGKSGKTLTTVFFSLTSAGIAFPLIWEATTKFAVFPPQASALALLSIAGLLMTVAWRRNLLAVAWTVILATLTTGFALMVTTSAIQTFTALFLVLGITILWLTYGRRWHALRWPTALVADASVLILGILAAWPGGPPEAYRDLSIPLALAQSLGLLVLYLGSIAIRTLQRNRAIILFESVQTAMVLLIGFGGAVRVAAALGRGTLPLGLAALIVGASCYAVAFAFVERQEASGKNFLFYTSLALVFTLAGTPTLLSGSFLTGSLALTGLLTAVLGVRYGRATLHTHAVIYLGGAALASGYLRQGMKVFLGSPEQVFQGFSPAELPMLIALAATHIVLLRGWGASAGAVRRRIPSFLLAACTVLGLGAYLTVFLSRVILPSPHDAGALAAIRTGVLAISAILLASLSRSFPIPEHRWLIYPILGLAALKFLFEDLAKGRPLTLFPALTLFGIALILVPRLLRQSVSGSPEDPTP